MRLLSGFCCVGTFICLFNDLPRNEIILSRFAWLHFFTRYKIDDCTSDLYF